MNKTQSVKRRGGLSVLSLAIIVLLPVVMTGQFYFGRNKIQYEDFDWQVLETEHFYLYYYTGEEQLGQVAAYFAEEAFGELELKFNCTFSRKIPLVVYSNHIHFKQTNILPYHIPAGVGGFIEYIKKRVVIPFNGNMFDFRKVIRHEMVHAFTHAKISYVSSDIGMWESPNFPLWFTEGLADLWSGNWDSQAEMVIRDALLYDHLYPLDSEALYRAGFLLYKEGQSFMGYFEETYGTDAIRRLMEDYWRYENFQETIKGVTGKEFTTLMLDWRLALKKQMAEPLQQDFVIGNGENQLTKTGTNVSPALYYDHLGNQHLVYLSSRSGYTDILSQSLDVDDRKKKTVLKGERGAEFESLHITQSGLNVSRDGKLAYVTKSGHQDVIRVVDLATRKEITSFSHPQIISIRTPVWSHDNAKIVFSAQNFNGLADLYIWTVDSSTAVRLTADIYSDSDPAFSPDDGAVVFVSDRGREILDGGTDLFILDLATRQLKMLFKDEYQEKYPRWSKADKQLIYFISDRSGTPNIWSVRINDNEPLHIVQLQQLTNVHTGIHDIVPLGADSLLVSSFQEYNFQIHRLPLSEFSVTTPIDTTFSRSTVKGWVPPTIPTTSSRKKEPYKLRYSLDLAQTAVAYDPIYGVLGGAQLSISDLLGNRYYHFLLTNTAQTSGDFLGRFNFAVTMVDLTGRSNLALGIFHFANDYFDPYQAFYFERTYGIRGGINYPLDVFRRLEFSGTFWYSYKDFYFNNTRSTVLISNFVSFIHDNSLWYYTGPIDGWRLRLTIGPTIDLKKSRLHNLTGLIDSRYYLRIRQFVTFAQRTMIWINDGEDIRRYYIGGSWGIRGYNLYDIYGSKYMMFNQELRFPLAHSLMLNFSRGGIGVSPIRGALFLDAGNAWDNERPDLIGSLGFGLRGLFLGGVVLRLDIGRHTDFKTIDRDWFVQFFFGWDY
ncbi:MAG: BamA/TamA family outer membrane protein [Candidatus Neomarinimicrobiota bacterium]